MEEGSGDSGSDLMTQLANLLQNHTNQPPQQPKISDNLQINLKLNSQNYALWTRMIRVAIGGRSKSLLSHLTVKPPEKSSKNYEAWEQEDLIVFSWLIQNIEPTLAGNLTEYSTTKELWDALVITYSSGRDKLQAFNLHVKANEVKQNGKPLEDFWVTLQGVWGEIDRIDPNPMTCPEDIKTYSRIRTEQKLFQFLNGLDQKYEPIKRELLRLETLSSVEVAYATVRKEAAHQNILGATNDDGQSIATGLTAGDTEGIGLAAKGHRRYEFKKPINKEDKTHLKCDECGMTRHTKDQCFRIVGYPEWWGNSNKKGTNTSRPTAQTSSDKKSNTRGGRQPATGFGGLVAAEELEEEEPSFSVTGYQDGSDYWAWH